jgi:hypothetical protein
VANGLPSRQPKAYLIDSILNGFDVPKFYLADFTYADSKLNKKKLPYAIIDGKQRFEAIFDFFEGKITLNEDFVFLENQALKLGGLPKFTCVESTSTATAVTLKKRMILR